MKSNREINFTTRDVKTISEGDIFCFFCIASVVCKCVCVCAPVGWRLLLCEGLRKPSSSRSLAHGTSCCCPAGVGTHVAARSPLHKNRSRYWAGNGTCTRLIHCGTSTISAHKIRQETELFFNCLKAVTTAAIKHCHYHNMRLFHGFASPPDVMFFNGFVKYRQSYLPVKCPPQCMFSMLSLSHLLP